MCWGPRKIKWERELSISIHLSPLSDYGSKVTSYLKLLMPWPPHNNGLSPHTNEPKKMLLSLNCLCHTLCHSMRNVKNTILYLRFSQQTRLPARVSHKATETLLWTPDWERLFWGLCWGAGAAPWEPLNLLSLSESYSSLLQHEPSYNAAWAMESQLVR